MSTLDNSSPEGIQNSSSATEDLSTAKSSTQKGPVLALPAVEDVMPTLDMSSGSATAKLDSLGPMVVNVDGTLSRITNWDGLADIEKKNTLRIITKRNAQRLAKLKAEAVEKEDAEP